MAIKLSLMVFLGIFVCNTFSQGDLLEYDVPCDHSTENCICPNTDDSGTAIDVCKFVLDIDLLHTFTRYELEKKDGSKDSHGVAGRVWYIHSDGVEKPHVVNNIKQACGDKKTDGCTEAFYADGHTFRSFIGVNSRIPGPTLIVNQHQLVQVEVNNRLASESISIHWHGMHQKDSNWMDGVEHVTQCGILPGGSFTYIFNATQSGTHWYHSHSGAQRTDGLFGALIVREKAVDITRVKGLIGDFEDIPENHTLTLWDWQKSNSIDLFTKIHSGIRHFEQSNNGYEYTGLTLNPNNGLEARTYSLDDAEVGPVTFWSGLINGRGKNYRTGFKQTRLSIFTVSTGMMYRFRIVGAQSLFAFRFSIDEHKLRLIATDGAFVNQTDPVDYIIIHSGERYDFLLETKTVLTKYNFMIRGETLEYPVVSKHIPALAILHYNNTAIPTSSQYDNIYSASNPISCTSAKQCTAINCPFKSYPTNQYITCINIDKLRLLEPFDGELPEGGKLNNVQQLFFNFGFEGANQTSAINGRNLKLPAAPLIQQETETCNLDDSTSDKCDNKNDFIISPDCYCTYMETVNSDESVELVLSAVGPKPSDKDNFRFAHPIHLHGHYFHIVHVEYGEYDTDFKLVKGSQDIDCRGKSTCVNPRFKTGVEIVYDDVDAKTGKIDPLMPVKDTVMVPYGGYVVVLFKANNPGYWFLHCHIEVHQLEGMGLIIQEGDPALFRPPPPNFPTCADFTWTAKDYLSAVGLVTTSTTTTSMTTATSTTTATPPTPTQVANTDDRLADHGGGTANKYCSLLIVLVTTVVGMFVF